ncbi:MAG: hypothetical protein EA397_05615 [Deltaproteobacteria bacterium]|nr:MAG: hypothetical protein EA397_05615 [Deltaproteobacteria bacterium]
MVGLLALLFAHAFAAPLPWTVLEAESARSWDAGPGAVYRAQIRGAQAAHSAEPMGLNRLEALFSPRMDGSPLIDDNTQVLLHTTLGGRRAARRSWWLAQVDHLDQRAAADRLTYFDLARTLWLDAWVATSLAEHLEEHAVELDAEITALRRGEQARLVSPMILDELMVEAGRLRVEAATFAQQAEVARVALVGHLGREVEVVVDSLTSLEVELEREPNPWDLVLERLDGLPELRALTAEAEVARTQSQALRRDTPIRLGAGIIWRTPIYDDGGPGPTFALTVPFGNASAPAAREAEARALAAQRARLFALQRQRATITAERAALIAAEARYELLLERVEGPLTERVGRLTRAVREGAAPIHLLLFARRDLHEAFHGRADAAAEVRVRRERGKALAAWLAEESP